MTGMKKVSVDIAQNELLIKKNKTGTERAIVVNSQDIASLKIGEEVKAKMEAGTNIAESVKVLEKKEIIYSVNIIYKEQKLLINLNPSLIRGSLIFYIKYFSINAVTLLNYH
jgi:hypothetical protein